MKFKIDVFVDASTIMSQFRSIGLPETNSLPAPENWGDVYFPLWGQFSGAMWVLGRAYVLSNVIKKSNKGSPPGIHNFSISIAACFGTLFWDISGALEKKSPSNVFLDLSSSDSCFSKSTKPSIFSRILVKSAWQILQAGDKVIWMSIAYISGHMPRCNTQLMQDSSFEYIFLVEVHLYKLINKSNTLSIWTSTHNDFFRERGNEKPDLYKTYDSTYWNATFLTQPSIQLYFAGLIYAFPTNFKTFCW